MSLSLFSLWALFALLVVNGNIHDDLPGYQIGQLCIWEGVALVIAAIAAYFIMRKFGSVESKIVLGKKHLVMHEKYRLYFSCYFFLLVLIGVWQFIIFSKNFN